MRDFKRRLASRSLVIFSLMVPPAWAQSSLLQAGPWTPGHAPAYVPSGSSQAVVTDSGPARGGAAGTGLSELLLQAIGTGTPPYVGQGTGPFGTTQCLNDGPTNAAAGYHFLCFSPNASIGGVQGGQIVYGAGGIGTPLPLQTCVNGTCSQNGAVTGAGILITTPIIVNFAVAGDNAIIVPLPPGFTQFSPNAFEISKCTGSLSGATFGAFTGQGATGGTLVTAGAVSTVTNNTPNTVNNFQTFNTFANPNIVAFTPILGAIQFRVGATASSVCLISFSYRPAP